MSEYNIKSIKEEFKARGIFYTTKDLAELVKSFVDIEVSEVYDPTCGDGALLSVFPDDVKKYGQEINEHQLESAKEKLTNFVGYHGDTLKDPAFADKKFKCIVANPPFSIRWDQDIFFDDRFVNAPALAPKSKADYAFILHILHYLSDDGVAVVLNFPGILYRGNAEGLIRKWIVKLNYIDKIVRIPGKTFVDTTIETALIVFRKNKNTTDIEFIDQEKGISRTVPIEEIIKNDYTLSVNSYVFEEKEVVKHDPIKLQRDSRDAMIKNLKADLAIDRAICEIEGFDFYEYIDEVINVVLSCK